MTETPEQSLSRSEDREILEYLRAKRTQRIAAHAPVLERHEGATEHPLSFAQQRLWFLNQYESDSAAYNMPFPLRLRGQLNVTALGAALQGIVQRHDALRTQFPVRDGTARQVVQPQLKVEMPIVDLSTILDSDREEVLRRRVEAELRRPFDLATGPLLRCRLFKVTETDHVLALAIHHIVSDGWSIGILNAELSSFYSAIAQGGMPTLAPLPLQYSDFSRWQRQLLSGATLARQLAYWREAMEGAEPLALPLDFIRPSVQTSNGSMASIALDASTARRLRDLALGMNATLAILLSSAFAVLLHRHTGQVDIVIGSPIANRTRRELEGLIGFFVNSLAMRTDLSGDPTFRELVRRSRDKALSAYEHQDLPFELLVQDLQPERDAARHPLFQVMFAVQNAPTTELSFAGVRVEPYALQHNTTRFDLECHVWDAQDGLSVVLFFNTDLFERRTADRLVGHFGVLLGEIASDPERRISQFPLSTVAERATLAELREDASAYPRDSTLAELFAKQVACRPAAVALRYAGEQLTFAELDVQSSRIANVLANRGIGREDRVGLLAPRGAPLVVAMLGISKAGAAYVPLDPESPRSRVDFVLRDSGAKCVLAERAIAGIMSDSGPPVMYIDDLRADAAAGDRASSCASSASDLAYIMYTSGSTGQPKGVCITQRAIARLLFETNYVRIDADDRIAQLASPAFDAATFEIWGALLHGAELIGIERDVALAPREFAQALASERVTILFLTTALFNTVARESPSAFRAARCVLFGGEAVDPRCVRLVLEAGPPAHLLHVYGPTESTTFASWHRVTDVAPNARTVPIGRALSNTTLHVLDEHGQETAPGVPGELFIGGDGLAREYLNDPELTSQRFLQHPKFGRIYRTGDRVRWNADAALEFIGRVDNQIKIRGFRVELGEIEAVLAGNHVVDSAAVLARGDAAGTMRLVAYVVPHWERIGIARAKEADHVQTWRTLYEHMYREGTRHGSDPTFNISGWMSSYTGEGIPESHMHEWVNATVARIASLRPHRVLEIGVGTGLLLHRLAPLCEAYLGTDFSPEVLAQLRGSFAGREQLAHVVLRQQSADDGTGVTSCAFDTAIINSVTQYLPTLEYLERALAVAVDAVAPGGHVFVGDVRSLPLLEAYHASVQFERAEDGLTVPDFLLRVREHVAQEEELVIDPIFFRRLATRLPRISAVEVQVKRGRCLNELTRFRYDVILHIERPEPRSLEAELWRNWERDNLDLASVRAALAQAPSRLGIRNVPNSRLAREMQLLQWLRDPPPVADMGALRSQQHDRTYGAATELEDLLEAAEELGYHVGLSFAASGDFGRLDLLFEHADSAAAPDSRVVFTAGHLDDAEIGAPLATNPLKGKLTAELVPALRDQLETVLPAYMVPGTFVVLESMPLNRNGKIDRRALPEPAGRRLVRAHYVHPRDELERSLADIWKDLLQLDQVGIHDNFFELGGHSLLATRVASRIRDELSREVPLRMIFEHLTVAQLADAMRLLDEPTSAAPAITVLRRRVRRPTRPPE